MLNTFLILMSVIAVAPVQVSVTPMRGDAAVGTLVDVTSQRLVIKTADGEVAFNSDQLLHVKPSSGPASLPPRSEKVETVVTLVDGSVLHATSYTVTSGRATVGLLGGMDITIPTRAIAHVRLMPLTPETAVQWQEILDSPRQSDAIVIRKTGATRDGQDVADAKVALDAPEGVVGDVSESSVEFEFDGSSVNVPRRKVQGVIYYHRTTSTARDPMCRLIDASGSQWNARSLNLQEDGLQGITVSGIRFTVSLTELGNLDYAVGNIDYLSDLPRESVLWKPPHQAGYPPSALRWLGPKFYAGAIEGMLKLGDESYEKGIALHSHAEVSYRLTKRYRSFLARVGVDDEFQYEADLELRIYGDNEEIFSRRINGQDPPFDLELNMQGVRRLKIVVGVGADGSERGDNLSICNARLTK